MGQCGVVRASRRGDELLTLRGRIDNDAVARVNNIMSEIEAATLEQSDGIEQVNRAIAQIDEATQRNAALVEEVAASAQSLESQAEVLRDAVAVFKVSDAAQVSNR